MDPRSHHLLVATYNPGKVVELSEMLSALPFRLFSLADFPQVTEVAETGLTFTENARLKASEYAKQTGLIALADDSGLEVEALDDRPGVLSARYGGEDLSFAGKMERLLFELSGTNDTDRRARFVCSMAIANEWGEVLYESKGVCEGHIAAYPRGAGGFGYDPIFFPAGYDLTFGELSEQIKNKISHRARAFEQIIPFLRDFTAN
jgi:XTP/dITP diphosphohydrolase